MKVRILTLLSSVHVSGVHVQSAKLQESRPETTDRKSQTFMRVLPVYMSSSLTSLAPSLDVSTRDERVRRLVHAQRVLASGCDFAFVSLCAVYKNSTC